MFTATIPNNSRIARPLSITSILQATSSITTTTATNNRRRVSSISEYEKKKQPQQHKGPNSRLSKSHSMHRLADSFNSSDEDEEKAVIVDDDYDKFQRYRSRALLNRATTTPMPRPSSLIKRFSTTTTTTDSSNMTMGANAAAIKSASSTTTKTKVTKTTSTAMKRSASLFSDTTTAYHSGATSTVNNSIKIGSRVSVPNLNNVFGTIRFFGTTQFKGGNNLWVGIELDIKGSGKNDGSIQGVRYFTCASDTGLFIIATKVVVLPDETKKKTITPRISRTTAIASANNITTRKSMISTSPKRNRSTTTSTTNIVPSKSARIVSSKSTNHPLPTRSSPSSVINNKKSTVVPLSTGTKSTAIATTTAPTNRLKKSSSLSTARTTSATDDTNACHHHHYHERSLHKKQLLKSGISSKTTRSSFEQEQVDEELKRVSALLEKSRQEKEKLSQQMNGQEAAWDRLVSAKESYALLVEEKDDEIMRLKKAFEQTRQATDQLSKITAERESAISRATMSEAMEKQHIKVIERLDTRVKTLQKENGDLVTDHAIKKRDYAAQIDLLRKQLVERDEATATIERECSELKIINVDTVRAYEQDINQLKQQHATVISNKDAQIERLQSMVSDFTIASPTTPIVDNTKRRLEAQLELSTKELDKERKLIKTMSTEINQLKDEIKRLHRVSVSSSSQFYSIRNELEMEIEDKKRIMEEANAALETQSRIEEENERIKMTHDKTQRDLADVLKKLAHIEKEKRSSYSNAELAKDQEALLKRIGQLETENERVVESQRQTEHDCMRLMDELLAIERVESSAPQEEQVDPRLYKREIEQLKLQMTRETQRYQDLEKSKQLKIGQLNKELSDLESLVENKVFMETELEEALENEKQKVRLLETKLSSQQQEVQLPLSPTSPHYSSIFQRKRSSNATALSSLTSLDTVSDYGSNLLESIYCEICEEYGHEVMTCNAFVQIDESQHDTIPSSSYCVNCDVFGTHPTEDCPNQDETF